MSISWNKIVEEAEGYVEKSGGTLSREQAVDRFLKTARGKELYAQYRIEGDPFEDLAKEELVVKAARIAKSEGLSGGEALARAVQAYPYTATLAGVAAAGVAKAAASVAKAGDSWQAIVEAATTMVEKSASFEPSGNPALDESRAVDAYLKTAAGKAAYAEYMASKAA